MAASTSSRKGNPPASMNKSKFGQGNTVYASTVRSRSNVLSNSASRKNMAAREAEKAQAAHKPPVQVGIRMC